MFNIQLTIILLRPRAVKVVGKLEVACFEVEYLSHRASGVSGSTPPVMSRQTRTRQRARLDRSKY